MFGHPLYGCTLRERHRPESRGTAASQGTGDARLRRDVVPSRVHEVDEEAGRRPLSPEETGGRRPETSRGRRCPGHSEEAVE